MESNSRLEWKAGALTVVSNSFQAHTCIYKAIKSDWKSNTEHTLFLSWLFNEASNGADLHY